MNHIKDHRGTYTVVVNNQSYTFDVEHPHYMGLVECVKSGDVDEFNELINAGIVIENWSEGKFRFENGVLYYVDEQVHSSITSRIIQMIREGFEYQPILNFLERLYQNPSFLSIN